MKTSQHAQSRMKQRAISKYELELVMAFGYVEADKVFLNKNHIKELINEFTFLKKQARGF